MSRHLKENMSSPKFLNECITDRVGIALHETLNRTQQQIALPSLEAKFTAVVTLKVFCILGKYVVPNVWKICGAECLENMWFQMFGKYVVPNVCKNMWC
jgi:hypothetical protein